MKTNKSVVSITLSYKRGTIRVSMGILERLELPKYIRLLVNASRKQFGVEATNKSDSSNIKITYPKNKLSNGYVIHSQFLLEQIYQFMNWDINKNYRSYGEFNDGSKVAVMNLKKSKVVHR